LHSIGRPTLIDESTPTRLRRIRRLLKILAIVAVGLVTHPSPAIAGQTPAQMYHARWTVRDGAPRNINRIAQTADGFLWLGTDNGLFRFDGQSFDRYQPSSGEPFPGTQVKALQAVADGGLWIGYGRVGVSFLKGGRNTNYGEQAGLALASVRHFAIDKLGTVWAQVGGSGLKRLDKSVWKTVGKDWQYPANLTPNFMIADRDGTVWVATEAGLFYLRSGEHAFQSVTDITWPVSSIAQTPNGVLWLGSLDAPARALDPSSAKLRPDIPPIEIRGLEITAGHDGSLWFVHPSDGVFRVDSPEKPPVPHAAAEESAQHFTAHDGLTGVDAVMVLPDREGSTWVLTGKGLDQFRPTPLTAIALPPGVGYSTTAVAGDHQIFMEATIVEIPTGHVLVPRPKSIVDITSIYRDSNNSLWFGGRSGLWELSGPNFISHPVPDDLVPARNDAEYGYHVQAMMMDRAGGLWVSFSRNGLYRLFRNTWSHMTNLRAAPNNLNTTMTIDSRGRIWFGFAEANIVQVLDANVVTTFTKSDGIDIGYTAVISEIGGKIVIGGESGIEVLQGRKFRRLRLAGDAPLNAVSGLLQQKNGDLWINHDFGIVKIEATEIAKALSNPDLPVRFTQFDELDGVDTVSTMPTTGTITDAGNGTLYFAMHAAVMVMDTSRLSLNPIPPTVIVRSLSDGTTEYVNSPGAVLPPNTDKVTIHFAASSLLIPQRVRFKYRLEGIDEEWQQGNGERFALYSRLPPGRYTFQVTASNNDGIWSASEASIGFTIPPSFVQSMGFKVLCAATVLALLWLCFRIKMRQMTAQVRRRLYERLEERTRIARDLHDTFFQGIQGLLLRFNTGTAMLKRDEPARAIFEDALEQSDRVMLEGRELMLDLRAASSNATELGNALVLAGNELKRMYPADFRVTVNGEPVPLHPVVFHEVHRLAREALSNAFRHSHANSIEAELHYERNQFRVCIRDDGVGIAADVLSRGFRAGHWGLPGMRERAAKLGGQVDIWSRPGAGAEIEFRVPAAAAYVTKRKRRKLGWLRAVTLDSESADE
jgi:signal transduction histidine kinase/streptogramin lyase